MRPIGGRPRRARPSQTVGGVATDFLTNFLTRTPNDEFVFLTAFSVARTPFDALVFLTKNVAKPSSKLFENAHDQRIDGEGQIRRATACQILVNALYLFHISYKTDIAVTFQFCCILKAYCKSSLLAF